MSSNSVFKNSQEVINQEASSIAKTFNRQPVVWVKGEGSRLWDKEGKSYLDFFSGHAVMDLGYNHPAQMAAMQAQLQALPHTGNLYYTEPQVELAKRLAEASFGDKVMFSNSGAEIIELAIKLARKWAKRERPDEKRYEIITMKGSFHGRTYGALTATAQEKYHKGIEPMLPGFKYVPFNNFVAVASGITNQTCAIMVEPVQGEGGLMPADKKYLQSLRTLCDQNHLLLIFDEIQCGLGRLGTRHAYEWFGVTPDVMLVAKPLGGGLPISALVTRADVATALQVGDHGSTFGGNPVAAAAGCVLLEELSKPGFLDQVRATGEYLAAKLGELAAQHPNLVKEVRGAGLMLGMELKHSGPEAVRQALQKGLVINCTAGHVLRLLPPLIIGKPEVDEACLILKQVFEALERAKEE
jgi:predicted acetylornithine/succinylornithine family transaminase